MARRHAAFTDAVIQRRVRQGRGAGTGSQYVPWIFISEVPSHGRSHRPFCTKTGREHHCLSDHEYNALLQFWFDDDVIDIREQFPILDRLETTRIARLLGVRHPVDPISRTTWVLTTDFLVTYRTDQGAALHAYSVKPSKDLEDSRILEKIEIERVYWACQNVLWNLLVTEDLKTTYVKNLEWIFDPEGDLIGDARLHHLFTTMTPYIKDALRERLHTPVRMICTMLDELHCQEAGISLGALRRMLSRKELIVDLDNPSLVDLPGSAFSTRG
jgi:hypothetical protein